MSDPARRTIPPAPLEHYLDEAGRDGFGKYTFGSHYMGGDKPDCTTVHFRTLVPASYYASDALTLSPVLFTRNAERDIVLPGRWWHELLAWAPVADTTSKEVLQELTRAVAGTDLVNAIVPHDPPDLRHGADHTVLVSLPDLLGRVVAQEVLLPGTEAFVPFPKAWRDLLLRQSE
jgi:hypothetical protein